MTTLSRDHDLARLPRAFAGLSVDAGLSPTVSRDNRLSPQW
jgi:hypothetical protein